MKAFWEWKGSYQPPKRMWITLCLATAMIYGTSAAGMDLKSPSIEEGRMIPERYILNGFGCEGQNISPALIWTNAPIEAKSFAVTLFDPDAPTGSGWWHWVLVNIPADVTSLVEGNQPSNALSTRTDFGTPGYGGPCPPIGEAPHRYVFSVFALDIEVLPLDASASGAMVGFMLNSHSLDKATLTAKFGR